MFSGFTDETFQFFTAIRFNNNTTFFHENHDWYERAVRKPLKDLAADLSEAVLAVDENLETRPEKVLSHINRDLRFTNDKSPYRDHMWLSFRRPGTPQSVGMSLYVGVDAQCVSFGFGMYEEDKRLMNGLRRQLVTAPEEFTSLITPVTRSFGFFGNTYKRMKIPDTLPRNLAPYYPLKSFYVDQEITDPDLLRSPLLVSIIRKGMRTLAPLYRYMAALPSVADDEILLPPSRPTKS